MRKSDMRFFYFIPCLIGLTVAASVLLMFQQMFAFTHSYLLEEQFELQEKVDDFVKDNEKFIIKGDLDKVNQNLKSLNIGLSLFDKNKKLLASNDSSGTVYRKYENLTNDIIYHIKTVNEKKVKESRTLILDSQQYYIMSDMPIVEVANILNRTERNISLTLVTGSLIVLFLSLYMFFKVRNPFVKLQKSAIKISNGEFENEIFVTDDGPLAPLSLAIHKMAENLKSQIEVLRKNEEFRKGFIEDISHEVKTPLTGIISSIGLLREFESEYPQNVKKCLNILDNNANRLNNLIRQILILANIEDLGLLKNKDFIKFDLKTSVENAIISCKELLIDSNTKLELDINESVEIMGEIMLVEQAVTNLIVNAIKYSKSPVIRVSLTKKVSSAIITIQDFGIGIDFVDAERIFDRFYRVDKTRSRELGGSGLGLAIVKNIVSLHDGTISLETQSGKGCKFTITIPCAE